MIKSFKYLLIAVSLVSALSVQAAEPYGNRTEADVNDVLNGSAGAYSPPAVYVTKTKVNPVDTEGNITGTFTLINKGEDTIGDLRYRIELLEALPPVEKNVFQEDTGRMFDTFLSSEIHALTPGEEKSVPFTYTPANVPAGNYRMKIQSTTSQGKDLGWDTVSISLTGTKDSFVDLVSGTILLPEFPDEVIPPLSGPNVSPSTTFTLRATATNPGTTPVTVTPTLTMYDFATSGEVVGTTPITSIDLLPGKATELNIPVTASANAGVYYGVLSLNVGDTRISPLAEYRWIVRGSSGKIISARIKQLQTKANEKVSVAVEYAGPADAETVTTGTLMIEVVDSNGVAGSFQVPETLELTDAVGGGIAGVTLTRDLVGAPGLRVTLTDGANKVLDVYEVEIPLSDSQLQGLVQETKDVVANASKKMSAPMYMLIGAGLLGLLALVLHLQKKGMSSATPLGLLFVIATTFAIAHGVIAAGNGTGIEVVSPLTFNDYGNSWATYGGDKPLIEIFINKPLHDAPGDTYTKDSVPFEYRMEYGVCKNTLPEAWLKVRFSQNGGKYSTLNGSGTWSEIINAKFTTNDCVGYYCVTSRSGNATLDLSALASQVLNTTLQIGSFWENYDSSDERRHGVPDEPSFNSTDWFIRTRHAHIVNLWLNFDDVIVPPSTIPQVPSIDLKINGSDAPPNVTVNSQAAITWTSRNVNTCTASSDWTGSKAVPNGSQNVTLGLVKTYTFTITCSGLYGSVADTVRITTTSPVSPAPITVDLKANESDGPITIVSGTAPTLTWTSTNTTGCTASGAWTGPRSQNNTTGELQAPITSTVTYTLQCTGGSSSGTDSVTVNVTTPPPAPTVDLKANGSDAPATIAYGSSATLSWTTTNAQSCWATNNWTGWKTVPTGSELTGNLTATTSYTLTCYSTSGVSATDSVTVNVGSSTGTNPSPSPSVSPSPNSGGGGGGGTFEETR